MKKIFSILMTVLMVCCFIPTAAFAAEGEAAVDGTEETIVNNDCSKTATELASDYTSEVTLSFPSEETELVTDIVFVLDKSTSSNLEDQALLMLRNLKSRVEDTQAKVKVGVVIFDRVAHTSGGFYDLETQSENIESAFSADTSSGTNLHAGLLAGKAMLDSDTSVPAERKHLIVVSDGITYMYNEEPTATAWTFYADGYKNWAGPDNWRTKYNNSIDEETYIPADWGAWLNDIGLLVEAQDTEFEYPYGGDVTNATPEENWKTDYANSVDKALYLSYQVYQEAKKVGYNCFAMCAESTKIKDHPWGSSFMNYLAGGTNVSFDSIERHVVYAVSTNSVVNDVIGKGIDNLNADYNFDFVTDYDMKLTVGEKEFSCSEPVKNEDGSLTYTFTRAENNESFQLVYYPGEEEHFEWYINQSITNFERVQLTYQVKLMNPSDIVGTHNVNTNDGHAILTPVDSTEVIGTQVEFPIPTVSYTVEKQPVNPPVYPSYTSVTAQKVWMLDNGGTAAESVQVQLLRDGQPYRDAVTLSAANQWKTTWTGLNYGYTYTVVEQNVPDGFTSSVLKNGTIFTITNDDVEQVTPPEPTDPVIPLDPQEPTDPTDPSGPSDPEQPSEPPTTVPKTGDDQQAAFWMLLMAATLAGLGVTLKQGRKER